MYIDFGSHLRNLRKERRMTQQQLADAVGIDFTYLSKVENGRVAPPSEDTIREIARELQIDSEDLVLCAGKVDPALKEVAASEPHLA